MNLLEELRRRNVFRVGAAYLLLAWVVIQVTDTVAPALGLPDWTLAFVTWVGVIGFPFAVFFAWAFELTPQGLMREAEVDRSASMTAQTGRRIDYVAIGLLVVAVLLFLLGDRLLSTDRVTDPAASEPAVVAQDSYGSIGVLPFVNMSDDPSQEYFSDGIAEELLNALAKLKDLQVAARTSSFAFKGRDTDISEIGRELNVDTVLEGSVRKSGSKLRITAQLIDVNNGFHLWSETYDRELTDVFKIQDEITASIVDALLPHFDAVDHETPAVADTTNMSAYDAYLQGRHYLNSLEPDAVRKALSHFRAATDADPDFAPAWAGRAVAVVALREDHFNEGIPREESHLLAQNSIDRALEIDPNSAEAYVAKSLLEADDYEYEQALASLEHALDINPNLADARVWRSRLLGRFGRIREARADMRKALQLDPHNPVTAVLAANLAADFYEPEYFAVVERSTGQFERARDILGRIRLLVVEPLTADTYRQAVAALAERPGRVAALDFVALKELDAQALESVGRNRGDVLMWIYMMSNQWDKAQAIYDALPPERQQSVLNLEELSIMQAAQGRCEEALETLRAAHGDVLRVHGMVNPNRGRSNSNLALNRVHCLRRLGREQEAEPILAAVRDYVETLRQNAVYGIFVVDAKLRVLEGDRGGALATLEAAFERHELTWTDRYDPILRTLADEPRFIALFDRIDARVDELRAELGMPPADSG